MDTPHPPYSLQYAASIAVAVVGAMLGGAIMAADALELSRQQIAVIGIVLTGLTMLATFLPKATKYPSPERRGLD